MKITHLNFVAVNERRLKFIQANSQESKEIWQALTVNDRIWKHCKNQARRLVSKICVQFDARKKKIKLCSASRMTFRAWLYRTDPQSSGRQLGTLSGFLRNTFWKRPSQKKPRNIFRTEKFQDYFWKTNTSLFLGGSAFRFGQIYILFY